MSILSTFRVVSSNPPDFTYLEYDANRGTVSVSSRVIALKGGVCPHRPPNETGDPFFDIRNHLRAVDQRHRRQQALKIELSFALR
jgi:hypothetical protein